MLKFWKSALCIVCFSKGIKPKLWDGVANTSPLTLEMCFPVWLKVTDSSVTLLVHIYTSRPREGLSERRNASRVCACFLRLWSPFPYVRDVFFSFSVTTWNHNPTAASASYGNVVHGERIRDSLCRFWKACGSYHVLIRVSLACVHTVVWHNDLIALWLSSSSVEKLGGEHKAELTDSCRLSWNESGRQKESSRLIPFSWRERKAQRAFRSTGSHFVFSSFVLRLIENWWVKLLSVMRDWHMNTSSPFLLKILFPRVLASHIFDLVTVSDQWIHMWFGVWARCFSWRVTGLSRTDPTFRWLWRWPSWEIIGFQLAAGWFMMDSLSVLPTSLLWVTENLQTYC